MEQIRQYLLSIICASVIVAIITALLADKKSLTGIVKLIAGVFLIFTVVAPVVNIEIQDFQNFYTGISEEAQSVAQHGEQMACNSTNTIIKEQLEAYILDKASSLNLDVDVSISLRDAEIGLPEEITIYGNYSPYSKKTLQAFLTEEIGIPEEKQIWK